MPSGIHSFQFVPLDSFTDFFCVFIGYCSTYYAVQPFSLENLLVSLGYRNYGAASTDFLAIYWRSQHLLLQLICMT